MSATCPCAWTLYRWLVYILDSRLSPVLGGWYPINREYVLSHIISTLFPHFLAHFLRIMNDENALLHILRKSREPNPEHEMSLSTFLCVFHIVFCAFTHSAVLLPVLTIDRDVVNLRLIPHQITTTMWWNWWKSECIAPPYSEYLHCVCKLLWKPIED